MCNRRVSRNGSTSAGRGLAGPGGGSKPLFTLGRDQGEAVAATVATAFAKSSQRPGRFAQAVALAGAHRGRAVCMARPALHWRRPAAGDRPALERRWLLLPDQGGVASRRRSRRGFALSRYSMSGFDRSRPLKQAGRGLVSPAGRGSCLQSRGDGARQASWSVPTICGSVSNWWKGGGEDSVHSSVVAPSPHGLSPAGRLRQKASAIIAAKTSRLAAEM